MQESSETPLDRPSEDDDVDRALDDAAEAARRQHEDDAERARRQEAAERAGENPRRES